MVQETATKSNRIGDEVVESASIECYVTFRLVYRCKCLIHGVSPSVLMEVLVSSVTSAVSDNTGSIARRYVNKLGRRDISYLRSYI